MHTTSTQIKIKKCLICLSLVIISINLKAEPTDLEPTNFIIKFNPEKKLSPQSLYDFKKSLDLPSENYRRINARTLNQLNQLQPSSEQQSALLLSDLQSLAKSIENHPVLGFSSVAPDRYDHNHENDYNNIRSEYVNKVLKAAGVPKGHIYKAFVMGPMIMNGQAILNHTAPVVFVPHNGWYVIDIQPNNRTEVTPITDWFNNLDRTQAERSKFGVKKNLELIISTPDRIYPSDTLPTDEKAYLENTDELTAKVIKENSGHKLIQEKLIKLIYFFKDMLISYQKEAAYIEPLRPRLNENDPNSYDISKPFESAETATSEAKFTNTALANSRIAICKKLFKN